MIRVPTHRAPTHPGEMLAEEFLKPLGLTQGALAERIGVPIQRVNLLVNRKRSITPDTALRLAKLFGTTADFWLAGQLAWDLYHARHEKAADLRRIRPLPRATAAADARAR